MSKCKICHTSHTRDELDDRGRCRSCAVMRTWLPGTAGSWGKQFAVAGKTGGQNDADQH